MSGYLYVWEFRARPGARERFEAAYGPEGEWVRLFRQAAGYLGSELLHDADEPGRYLTIDRWESRAACDAFRERFATAFEALDARCEALTERETKLGDFEPVP